LPTLGRHLGKRISSNFTGQRKRLQFPLLGPRSRVLGLGSGGAGGRGLCKAMEFARKIPLSPGLFEIDLQKLLLGSSYIFSKAYW
jgi:hypothetical protein